MNEQGYSTVFFASTSNNIDNFGAVVRGFGYREFYPVETMDREGFEVTNTFGYEDDVMLKPSEEWLKERGNEPFMAEYLISREARSQEALARAVPRQNPQAR